MKKRSIQRKIRHLFDDTTWVACQFRKLLLCNELAPPCHIWDQLQIKVSFNMCAVFHSFQEETFLFELWILLMKKWGKSMLFRRTNWEEETWWNERLVVIDSCGVEILELGSGFQKEDLTDLRRVSKDSFLLIHIWAITRAVTEIQFT